MTRTSVLERLRIMGEAADDAIDLVETALLLAACDKPGTPLAPYRRHAAELVEAARTGTGNAVGLAARIAALRRVLVDEFGYSGDSETYDDPRNANLIEVIDRRRGLPVSLGLLAIHTFRGAGGGAVGLQFPSHFMVRLEARKQRAIVDPFDRMKIMEAPDLRRRLKALAGDGAEIRPDYWSAASHRDVLIRLQNNVKLRALAGGDLHRALEVLETMTAIAPDRLEFWWETAVACDRLGDLGRAIVALEEHLARAGSGAQAAGIADLLLKLKARRT